MINVDDVPKKKVFKYGGWTFRATRSHILSTEGHYSWKRELSCFQGQSLPDALFYNNSLEIFHDSTGIRIRFCAMEALRAWASLELEPVKVSDARSRHWKNRVNITPSVEYDYTYTTLYPGGTDIIEQTRSNYINDLNYLKDNSSSFIAKKVIEKPENLVGPARLRKPLCRCRGDGGRAPFFKKNIHVKVEEVSSSNDAFNPHHDKKIIFAPPRWEENMNNGKVNIEGMIQKYPQPLCYEIVDLYEDDLHENGTCFLKAKIFVTPVGWVALLRFFLRVDGVMARVVDTRFIHNFGELQVLRERSWREGSWKDLIGEQSEKNPRTNNPEGDRPLQIPSLESANDSIAARVLGLKYPETTESLSLEKQPDYSYEKCHKSSGETDEVWKILSHFLRINTTASRITCPTPFSFHSLFGISMISISKDRKSIYAFPTMIHGVANILTADTQYLPWTKSLWSSNDSDDSDKMTTFLSLQVSSDIRDGGRLLLGDDNGWGHVWRLSTGESLLEFPVASENTRARYCKSNIASARLWVDHVVWSRDGTLVGAAAGRSAVVASAQNGLILYSFESMEGSITGIAFRNHSLALASYGVVHWLTDKSENNAFALQKLKRKGASIQCIDVSPDGSWVAVGFLDKTLRIFDLTSGWKRSLSGNIDLERSVSSSAIDWIGFNSPVKLVHFSEQGNWLAAMGGSSILVLPVGLDSKVDAPTVCRTHGQTASDGCDGTCKRFLSFMWPSSEEHEECMLFAIDESLEFYIFDVTKTDQGWPKRSFPLSTIE